MLCFLALPLLLFFFFAAEAFIFALPRLLLHLLPSCWNECPIGSKWWLIEHVKVSARLALPAGMGQLLCLPTLDPAWPGDVIVQFHACQQGCRRRIL
jgi:hypothetical protein